MKLSLLPKRISAVYIAKISLSLAATVYLFFTIKLEANSVQEIFEMNGQLGVKLGVLTFVFAIMPLNWLVESLKWRQLQWHNNPLSVKAAYEGVLMGIPVTWLTPNGIGSFLGRMLRVVDEQRELAVATTIIGNLAQLLTTLIIGLFGGLIVVYQNDYVADKSWVPFIAVGLIAIILWFLANISKVLPTLMLKFSYYRKRPEVVEAIRGIQREALLEAIVYSFIRYFIFSLQLWLLLKYVGGLTGQTLYHLALIPVYYLLKAAWPTITFGEVAAKGVLMQALYGHAILPPTVVLIPLLLWLINTIVPGIVGLVLLYKSRVE